MSKRIKTDSVEELMEIVKAIQNGEEPDEAVRKKRLEEEAAIRAEAEEQAARRRKKKKIQKTDHKEEKPVSAYEDAESGARRPAPDDRQENRQDSEMSDLSEMADTDHQDRHSQSASFHEEEKAEDPWEDEMDDDEFDRILDEDSESSLDIRPVIAALSSAKEKISGMFAGIARKSRSVKDDDETDLYFEDDQKSSENEGGKKASAEAEDDAGKSATDKNGKKKPTRAEDDAGKSAGEKDGPKKPTRAEDNAWKSAGEKDGPKKPARAEDDAGKSAGEKDGPKKPVRAEDDAEKSAVDKDGQKKSARAEDAAGKSAGTRDGKKKPVRAEDAAGKSAGTRDGKKKPTRAEDAAGDGEGKAARARGDEQKTPLKDRLGGFSRKASGVQTKAADALKTLKDGLSGKGIQRREMAMLGMGLVLFILVVILAVNGISSSLAEKEKKKNVVADEGLTVLVEQEPDQWCSSYPVVLRVKVKTGTISSVTVDGAAYEPDENGLIVVNTGNYLMNASVRTDEGELTAQIEVPMLDSQDPVVTVSKDDNQIIVSAADGRSGVSGIYYAVVEDNAFQKLPVYHSYTEPLVYEKEATYYFYARDNAGNSSTPIVTTMETAEALAFGTEELSLFPGETGELLTTAVPEGALLNNLTYESGNPEVAVVDELGIVTGVAEGTTVVKASADGVEAVSCAVTVSSSRTVTISMIGDCTLGTDASFDTSTNFDAFYSVYGYGHFFQNVKSILENDDATFANLEGPLTTASEKATTEIYAFKGDPSYTQILTDGSIDVVTLANNHTNDYGQQGLDDTKMYLEQAGIDYCINDELVVKDVNGIQTAFIGIYELNEGMGCESRVRSTIAEAQARGAQIIIVAFHWGSEKANVADDTQRSLAHTAIDCGASLVVGHHPHVLQGIEKYNGKYIVYSLGNFCFGGNSAPSDMDTMIFRQTFTVTRDGVQDYDQIEIVPCSISSGYGYNNYQPTPAEGSEAERIIERINEYSSEFGQTYTASSGLESA